MARINSLRVNDVLSYERDIKGKRLIRLSAGVCSGKNYWITQIAKSNPDLRILLITSRKNTVLAHAVKLEANTFIDLDSLNMNATSNEHKRVICTNVCIEKFFKYRYKADNPATFLWNKFDLIVLDEAHALTNDATFTDCFYTERFLKHTYYKNKNCDILFMSGTLTPLKWMIDEENTPPIHDLNCFDTCVHLEPDFVYVFDESVITSYIYNLWKTGEKIIYFANFKKNIARLTEYLTTQGVPVDDLGFSFNYSAQDKELFPKEIADTLEERIDEINIALTTNELVPNKTKILFTTSKNKEGVNILNDDIKTIIAETHSKSDLIQIAGRVRGNATSGTGVHRLVIVGNAKQYNQYPNEFLYTWNKHISVSLTETLRECVTNRTSSISTPDALLGKLRQYNSKDTDAYKYIRYDYIGENYCVYEGRIESERQSNQDILEFKEIASNSVLRKDSSGQFILFSGKEIMEEEWFKWSKVYIFPASKSNSRSREALIALAREQLLKFLVDSDFIGEGKYITKEDRDIIIKEKINSIAKTYGYEDLGISEGFSRVGSVLKKFGIKIKEHSKKKGYEKYKLVVD